MKKKTLLAVLVILPLAIASSQASAHVTEVGIERSVGVGLSAGSVPGVTLKLWTGPTGAVDLGVGFGLGGLACSNQFNLCDRQVSVHGDYMLQSRHLSGDRFGFHLGLGARFWFWSYQEEATRLRLAARIPIGVDLYLFRWLEAYAEVVPSLEVEPVLIFLEGALGARFYL